MVHDYKINLTDFSDFDGYYQEQTNEKLNMMTLRKLELIKSHQKQVLPTNAYFLFSNQDVKRKLFPYAKIECARFKGVKSEEFIDQKTYDGSIATQAELAYEFVLRHVNQGAIVEGVYTKSRWEYPVKAVREVIRNAVVHRDYSMTGKDIKVAVYDNMIEITSPGKLLPSIDFNDSVSRQSDIRNKVIAPIFKKIGIIDQWGNGLKLIADEMRDYPEIKFKWMDTGMQFQVLFVKTGFIENTEKKQEQQTELTSSVHGLIQLVGTKLGLSWDQVGTKLGPSWDPVIQILEYCINPRSIPEIMNVVQWTNRTKFRNKYIILFLELGLLEMTQPDKPKSSKQQYYLTESGKSFLDGIKDRL